MPFGSLGRALSGLSELAVTAAPLLSTAGAIGAVGPGASTLTKLGAAGTTLAAFQPQMQQQGQSVAIDTASGGGQESAGSGESGQQLLQNRMLPGNTMQILDQVRRGLRDVGPGMIGGGLSDLALDALQGYGNGQMQAGMAPIVNGRKLRVTRKLKTQVRQAVDLIGIEATAASMGVDPSVVLYIMTHKLRNDGPYVTKAAVRKTRSTIKKMKTMCDMYDDLRPPAKRSAPARRRSSSTTLIKN